MMEDVMFIMGFAKAVVKLREAENQQHGCVLTLEESQALIEALRVLKNGEKK